MATLADLGIGGTTSKRPPVDDPKEVGQVATGVIKEIDSNAPTFEFKGKRWLYWVDGKPTPLEKKEAEESGARMVTTIIVTVINKDGEERRIPFRTKHEKEVLAEAIEAAGGEMNPGDTIGKKLVKREGNTKTFAVKLVKPTQ
jgi:hypothetical protein